MVLMQSAVVATVAVMTGQEERGSTFSPCIAYIGVGKWAAGISTSISMSRAASGRCGFVGFQQQERGEAHREDHIGSGLVLLHHAIYARRHLQRLWIGDSCTSDERGAEWAEGIK